MIETIKIENESQWLGLRVNDITSTDVAALYGLSPYKTEFELFHEKRDGQVVRIPSNERMRWGNRLEAAIAHGAAEDMGWEIAKFDVYMRDPEARIGSSFDFEIVSSQQGRGILEVKNVDGIQYARNWIDDGAGNIEAPEHIELQIQHQMEVADYDWCALVALVGGNQQKIIFRNRDKDIGADIRLKAIDFWNRVAANNAPTPDYVADADYIIKQLHSQAEEGLVAQSDNALDELIERYAFLSRSIADQTGLRDATKAQILERVGKASKIISPLGTISCGMTKESLGKVVTQDMVGTYLGARQGFRNFRFNKAKGE